MHDVICIWVSYLNGNLVTFKCECHIATSGRLPVIILKCKFFFIFGVKLRQMERLSFYRTGQQCVAYHVQMPTLQLTSRLSL